MSPSRSLERSELGKTAFRLLLIAKLKPTAQCVDDAIKKRKSCD